MIAHALPLWVGGKRWARIVFKTMSAWILLYDLEKLLWNERVTWHARQCPFGCSPSKHNEISCCIFFLRVSRNILMMFHIGKTIEFTVACEQRVPTFPSNFRVTDAWNQTHVLVTRGKMRGISSEMRCNVTKKKKLAAHNTISWSQVSICDPIRGQAFYGVCLQWLEEATGLGDTDNNAAMFVLQKGCCQYCTIHDA